MAKRQKPRIRQPDIKRLLQTARTELRRDQRIISDWTKFEEGLAERKNPFPPIPEGKLVYDAPFFKKDCPLLDIRPLAYAEPFGNGVIIYPDGFAHGLVAVPRAMRNSFMLNVHVRSTLARFGIDIALGQNEHRLLLGTHPLPDKLIVTIANWGLHPVILRKGDKVVLSNTTINTTHKGILPETAPQTSAYGQQIDIHAGNTRLEIVKDILPIFRTRDGREIRVIDPQAKNKSEFTRVRKFKKILARLGDFLVIGSREDIKMPSGHIGVVHRANDGLMHSSATLVYPEWKGVLALELKVIQNTVIRPGMLVARMSCHQPLNHIAPYQGRYQNQQNPKPRG